MHGGDHSTRGIRVIAGHKIFSAILGIPEFEVRHVNVYDSLHPLDAFEAVVGRGVIDERQTQTVLDGAYQRFKNLRNDVLGRDKVDVVAADPLQIEHDFR